MKSPFSQITAKNIKNAIEIAKERLLNHSNSLAITSVFVLLSFVLMALIAPFAFKMNGVFQTFLSIIPFIMLMIGLGLAIKLLLNLAREEKNNIQTETQTRGTIATAAVLAALSEVQKVKLLGANINEFDDCLTGRIGKWPMAIIQGVGFHFAIIKVKNDFGTFIMLSQNGKTWPLEIPSSKPLVNLLIPQGLNAKAWTSNNLKERNKAQTIIDKIIPALETASLGGDLPFIVFQERSIIMAWENGDLGGCSLIASEIAKSLQ